MKVLSVFVDESGDFGKAKENPSYYLVSLVLHEQDTNISEIISTFDKSIDLLDLGIEYVHTGPIIRKESIFANYSLDERRKILYKILNFYNKCPIKHHTVSVNRAEAAERVALSVRIAKGLKAFIDENTEYLNSFDKIIVYYDNGQIELSSILGSIFSICFSNVEFRKAEQQSYRLLQIADFICSIELLRIKQREKRLSKSETKFFYKSQELKKTFIKSLDKKYLK